jgi:hypothetical protein
MFWMAGLTDRVTWAFAAGRMTDRMIKKAGNRRHALELLILYIRFPQDKYLKP